MCSSYPVFHSQKMNALHYPTPLLLLLTFSINKISQYLGQDICFRFQINSIKPRTVGNNIVTSLCLFRLLLRIYCSLVLGRFFSPGKHKHLIPPHMAQTLNQHIISPEFTLGLVTSKVDEQEHGGPQGATLEDLYSG